MVFLCGELWRHENERESGTTCPGLLTVETRTLLRVVSRDEGQAMCVPQDWRYKEMNGHAPILDNLDLALEL